PPFNPVASRQFFTVWNVQAFAIIFCRKRHYQYPLIHWPTFHLEEVSLPLLMVVALTGATYSYRPGHGLENIKEARKLYHVADGFVFERLETFLRDTDAPLSSQANQVKGLQLCQASLLMYGLETLSISDSAIHRIAVTERLPAIVTALRRLQTGGFLCTREQVIRLATWAFAVDGLATLCCNNPPVFSMPEMSGSLPCNPALWDADSGHAFGLLRREYGAGSLSLKGVMSRLLHGASKNHDCEMESLIPFELHIVICGKLPPVINLSCGPPTLLEHLLRRHVRQLCNQSSSILKSLLSLPRQSTTLLQALTKWKRLWERALGRTSPHCRKYLGMANNIPAIEQLSRRIVQIATRPQTGSSRYLERVPFA
ncbi:hypothetical protein PpBr36_02020, partial [Pyricularia pennisetigena]|uniref:hypothetical protein n=1 Tax=Pyricularia pennisetigena TaxID=1578925 RepID=UPI00114E0426